MYFEVFDHLITESKDAFFFRGRRRRPPLDNMNALLSFLYTLLTHDVAAALEGVGLGPGGWIPASRPAGASESGAGSGGGIAAGAGGPAGAFAG